MDGPGNRSLHGTHTRPSVPSPINVILNNRPSRFILLAPPTPNPDIHSPSRFTTGSSTRFARASSTLCARTTRRAAKSTSCGSCGVPGTLRRAGLRSRAGTATTRRSSRSTCATVLPRLTRSLLAFKNLDAERAVLRLVVMSRKRMEYGGSII